MKHAGYCCSLKEKDEKNAVFSFSYCPCSIIPPYALPRTSTPLHLDIQ